MDNDGRACWRGEIGERRSFAAFAFAAVVGAGMQVRVVVFVDMTFLVTVLL
jgi:hypothetical protein